MSFIYQMMNAVLIKKKLDSILHKEICHTVTTASTLRLEVADIMNVMIC